MANNNATGGGNNAGQGDRNQQQDRNQQADRQQNQQTREQTDRDRKDGDKVGRSDQQGGTHNR
ncbi:hypothetical protein HL653_02315 [Sphingomonas sp. AP4-R1]|uniref:hypothetical protein n=1 Tax=Sphingomonas sp. AP4-R1 TaxID=2735134 RepID=UPI001493CCD8|nr:hypothetical protein [Sphingomonas sp. AP4-R1]QJU56776.1 hypothetical protein HL653_02315 [Sphingomonas sp. AP4-R1]